jgi:hypothetical protein
MRAIAPSCRLNPDHAAAAPARGGMSEPAIRYSSFVRIHPG